VFGHHGVLESGTLKVGDAVSAEVDQAKRGAPSATTRRPT
jgi:alanyl-tRNA synthetase